MPEDIRTTWLGIVAWLGSEAPMCRAAIRDPAPSAEVDAALSGTGLAVPDFVGEWWALHDGIRRIHGATIFPGLFWPLGVKDTLDLRQLHLDIGTRTGGKAWEISNSLPAGENAFVFPRAFVPLAVDGTGCILALDLRGGDRNGCVKIFDRDDGALYSPVSPSFSHYLQEVLDLLHGRVVGRWTPQATDGWLDWTLSP
jgi:cell wall assembly regulator SMI1